MKCAILTFHFAHNYGAMLQAFALKRFLEASGREAAIADYASDVMRRGYHPRLISWLRPSVWLRAWRRRAQAPLFERFYREALGCCETTNDLQKAIVAVKPEALVVGSDQVWNDRITVEDDAYFHPLAGGRTVSYAASFGRSELSAWQVREVQTHLRQFDRISVREPDGAAAAKALIPNDVATVLDPVFLLSREDWMSMAVQKERGGYILYYSLKDDPRLIEATRALSQKEHLPVLAVHPLCVKQKVGTTLRDAGPREFLGLVGGAKYVCANSFHAAAFSVILGKKLLQVPISTKETRVASLLERIGADSCRTEMEGVGSVYDFGRLDRTKLDAEIEKSKAWLREALQ